MVSLSSLIETGSPSGTDADDLRRVARKGDARAMMELGARLLVGADVAQNPEEAATWLSAAADHDHVPALELLATIRAAGVLALPDWGGALDLLGKAAAIGSAAAQRQLVLLATGLRAPSDPRDAALAWREAIGKIDISAWMTPPPRIPICEAPRVRKAAPFAGPAVCDWIRGKTVGRMRAGTMYHPDLRMEQVDPHRSCGDFQFDILSTDLIVQAVRERIAALTKLPILAMEPPRVFHYDLGQEIKPHYDRFGNADRGYGVEGGYRGDRIVTFLLYLNDDFDGGDLDFPKAGFRAKGAKGDAIYFAHVDIKGEQDPLSLHAGMKVTRGEKYVLSQWIHDRPFGVITAPTA
jgi:hypothetical protein